ncbi:facilitated trehalose transporter Tret1 isoform X2 [Anabrus simplex]|uniref:facilitated trehalose transporter Tret1 isoform X2 n=1 Tax=Anabrus simplex TaxID=316456 RepID=UPI0035A37672
MGLASSRTQIFATCTATLAFFTCGTFMGWPSPTIARLQSEETEFYITSDEGSWIVSCMPIASILTPIPAGYLVNKVGRKTALLSASLPFLLSWLLVALAQSVWMLYAARLFAGLGLGITFTVGPMYLGEIAEDRIRGALGTVYQLMMNLGVLFEYCVGPYVSSMWLSITSALFPVLFLLTFIWMPESPYYYILKGRRTDAERSLMRLRCVNDPEFIKEELDYIEKFVEQSRTEQGSFKDLLCDSANRKALIIVVGLILFQNLSGINAILAYSTTIFEESNTDLRPQVSVMITGAVQVVLSMVSSTIVDTAGRRPMLLVSGIGTVIALVVEGVFFYLKTESQVDLSHLDWLPVSAIVFYLIAYTLGLGPLPLAMLGELFPTSVKGLAASITCMILGLVTIAVVKFYQAFNTSLALTEQVQNHSDLNIE